MAEENDATYYLYYRTPTILLPEPRDHFIKDDEALCNYGVHVPDEEKLKSITEISENEWAVLLGRSSNLCGECLLEAEYEGILPEYSLEEEPAFLCPQGSEEPRKVDMTGEIAYVVHGTAPGRGKTCKIPRDVYDKWRRNPE